jgi:hypothetical protein
MASGELDVEMTNAGKWVSVLAAQHRRYVRLSDSVRLMYTIDFISLYSRLTSCSVLLSASEMKEIDDGSIV